MNVSTVYYYYFPTHTHCRHQSQSQWLEYALEWEELLLHSVVLRSAFDFGYSFLVSERFHLSQMIFKLNQVFNAVKKILSAEIMVKAKTVVKPTIVVAITATATSVAPFK